MVGNQQNLQLPKHVKRMVGTTFHWTMGRETEVDIRKSHPVPRREVEKNAKIRYRMQCNIIIMFAAKICSIKTNYSDRNWRLMQEGE